MHATSPHPALFSPLQVGPFELPNRVIMGSMHTNLEELGEAGAAALAAFYAERARNGVALLVSGGYAPNPEGRMKAGPGYFNDFAQLPAHTPITTAVHEAGGRILLQILHSGRYGMHGDIVAPSPIKAPISRTVPRELSHADILRTIDDYCRCAELAVAAGYDGCEIMGSEGYLISQFCAPRTNQRDDAWGGSADKRRRFALEITSAVRAALGPKRLLAFRLSVLDLVEGGMAWAEIAALAQALEAAGVDLLSTGIGWHESPVPTVQQVVPPALFSSAVAPLKDVVTIPVCASNRITTPALANELIAQGQTDLVALARPLLADPAFVRKAQRGEDHTIVPCIACNQACLDHYFTGAQVSCMVNPRCGHELDADFALHPTPSPRRVAVVGAGPAGLAVAATAAQRGHQVQVFEAQTQAGGQFQLAAQIPGKDTYAAVVDAYVQTLRAHGGELLLGQSASAEQLSGFDHVVLASGIRPRIPAIPGIGSANVVGYEDVLSGRAQVGARVAIIGAGGIAFDVAAFLSEPAAAHPTSGHVPAQRLNDYVQRWSGSAAATPSPRQIWMLKRSAGAAGMQLGKTTGWVLRRELAERGVQHIDGAQELRIDEHGVHYVRNGESGFLAVDTVVNCTGQEANHALLAQLQTECDAGGSGPRVHVIGGAADAQKLDASRAFSEGFRLGCTLN